MKNRFYVPALHAPLFELQGDEFHHAVRVARSRTGEEVECFDGHGHNVVARFVAIDRDGARLEVVGEAPSREAAVRITLALALIQPERFELVLQKATELGVAELVPLVADRCEVPPGRVAGRRERWQKIVLEAVKQSGRSRIPAIAQPVTTHTLLGGGGTFVLFDADEEPSPAAWHGPATLLIGPEGGWSPREIAAAREANAAFRRLGPRRLRAETAAITAVALHTLA